MVAQRVVEPHVGAERPETEARERRRAHQSARHRRGTFDRQRPRPQDVTRVRPEPVDRPVTAEFLAGMARGVRILGERTKPCKVSRVDKFTFRIILTQGLNRQIRRMCEVFGYDVRRLQRIRIMHIRLGNLKPGQWRNLTEQELRGLK